MTYPKASTGETAPAEVTAPADGTEAGAPADETGPAAPDGGAGAAVPASPRFPEIEERVLAYWAADDTFRASVENRPAGENGANEFVFYDGPPFANGLPHYGHLLTGYVKDLIPRYQTMRIPTGCPPSWRP